MDPQLNARIDELEQAVYELQDRATREDTRRRRAATMRIVAIIVLGAAYAYMLNQSMSVLNG